MAFDFNADEVFRIAEEIERNGADFYGRLAARITDASMRNLFSELASMEKQHEKVFSKMKAALSEPEREATTFDPAQEGSDYLKALAGISVVEDKTKRAFLALEGLSGEEGLMKALGAAIDLEKESVVFYLGMKEFVPARLGRDRLEEILKEEMSHIRVLGERLLSLRR